MCAASPSFAPSVCAIVSHDERRVAKRGEPDPEHAGLELGTSSAAASIASRVFPEPPGPVSVTSRAPLRTSATTSATSRSRPTNDARRPWQVRVRDRLQRRKRSAAELEDRHRLGEVLQPMLAQVGQPRRSTSPRVAADSNTWPPCPALITRAARCTSRPTYFGGSTRRRTRCKPTLTRIGPVSRPRIASLDRLNGRLRRRERVEERVPLVVHLVAVSSRERLPHHPAMLPQGVPIRVRPQLLQQSRRALDVGEHQGHRARWLRRHRSTIPPVSSRDNRLALGPTKDCGATTLQPNASARNDTGRHEDRVRTSSDRTRRHASTQNDTKRHERAPTWSRTKTCGRAVPEAGLCAVGRVRATRLQPARRASAFQAVFRSSIRSAANDRDRRRWHRHGCRLEVD